MPTVSLSTNTSICCLCQQASTSHWNAVLKAPVCQACRAVFGYGTPNESVVGQPLKRLPSFSLEFEVAVNQHIPPWELDRALLLIKYHFKRTQDGTVDYEYKSPIYQNIRAARKALTVMDTLSDLVSDRCGTHLHIACRHKELLRSIQGDVFSPLLTHMLQNPEETTCFWGRYFNEYATPVNKNRYHCFNLESKHQTVEFRLPRFRTADQYLRVIKFARASVAYLDHVVEDVFEVQRTQQGQSEQAVATPGVRGLLPSMIGQHVLRLYRAHIAREKSETSWFGRLSPEEQIRLQTFPLSTTEQCDDDREDEDEDEETDDWSL